MGRKYVRDKMGRFAPKGGGTRGKGGKMGKSAKNLKARATYKAAASKLRKKQSGIGINTSKGSAGHRKQIGGAKSGLTRVTNKLTKKRAAAGSGIKKNFADQTKASRAKKFRSKTTKGRAAKSEWKAARRADRKSRSTTDSAQKRVIKKQTGKKAYSQGFRETPAKTKAPRAGSKTKAQKIRSKIDKKKFANKELRGSEFKGVKKRQSKGEKAVANRKKPERVRARKREEQGLALAGKKAYRKGPGAAERKAAVTGKTMKSTVGRKEKAAYKKQRSKNQPTYRVLAQSKGSKSPSAFIYKDAKAARKFADSFKNDGKATFKALGGGNKQPRGVKKRRGAKAYDNTTNTSIKMKTVKKNLRRKYPQSKAAKSLEKRVAAKATKNKSEIKMTRRQYSKVHKDFKSSDPKNPRTLKWVEGKGTVSMPVKFVKKYNQTDAFAASKAKRGSAATKRDRILRTAKRNLIRGGPSGPSAARRRKRMQMAEDIMTKAMGGSTAWKNFGPRF